MGKSWQGAAPSSSAPRKMLSSEAPLTICLRICRLSKKGFADDRSPASEQQRVHEDELHSLMRSILDWAIWFCERSTLVLD